jgi:isopenicillin-N N-acyltransferase-like protein
MTYPHVVVRGRPSERGRSHGLQARDRVRRSLSGYEHVLSAAGWEWGRARRFARRYRGPIADYDASALDELAGIAAGANVDLDDVLALNVRTELLYAARAALPLAGECTAFAVLPARSATGATLVGQNWDWLLHSRETVVVLEVEPADHPGYVTVVEAGLLAKIGVNRAGIGVITNALASERDAGEPGVPYHVLLRALHHAHSLADARDALSRAPRASSANYLVASADGAFDFEAEPGGPNSLVEVEPVDGVLAHTNHFVVPRAGLVDCTAALYPSTHARQDAMHAALARERLVRVEVLQEALCDHAGAPSSVCCHPDGRVPELERGCTAASLVADLGRQTVWLADGNPCETGYRVLEVAPTVVAASTG